MTALAKFEERFPVLVNPKESLEIIVQGLEGIEVNAFSLPMAKVAGGGTQAFDIGGETEKSLTGVIISKYKPRAFYELGLDDAGSSNMPPDCSSMDGVVGEGHPGGSCRECPLSKFGTQRGKTTSLQDWQAALSKLLEGADPEEFVKKNASLFGRGQACSQGYHLYLLPEGEALPTVVKGPTKSIKPIDQFLIRCAAKLKDYRSVVVELTVKKQVNPDGQAYGVVQIKPVGALGKDQLAAVKAYAEGIAKSLSPIDGAA